MRTNIKSKFGFLVSLLTLFVITSSCEKDLYENSIKNESREITVKQITIEDVQSNKEALLKLTDPNSRFKTNTNSLNKTLNDTINNFTIDTDHGLYIEVGNYNSYTFKINRPNGSNYLLENIIVSKKNETEYETFINQYNITEQELELIETGAFIDLTGKTNKITLESAVLNDHLASKYFFNGSCYEDNYVYVAGNICPAGIHNLSYIMANMGLGSQCEYFLDGTYTATGGSWIVQSSIVPCDNIAGGDSPGGDTSGGHPGSGGSGSTYTGAVGSNPNELIIKRFIKGLPDNLENWYSIQPQEFKSEVDLYLISNNLSDESMDEIKNIMDILHDGIVDGEPVLVGPDVPIDDMEEYLSCFNTDLGATITIYADQPTAGGHNVWSVNDGVGHAFISIQQGSNVASFGFYPQSSVGSIVPNGLTPNPRDFFSTPGVFGNNQGHEYDVSLSISINSEDLTNLIDGAISVAENSPMYNIGSLNCTDFAILLLESNTNIDIPSCESPGLWQGQTPGTLGEIIRNMTTPVGGIKNTTGGNAPNNNCN